MVKQKHRGIISDEKQHLPPREVGEQVLVSEVSEGGQVRVRACVRVRTHLAASATCTVAERTGAGHTAAPAAPCSRWSSSLHFTRASEVQNIHITPEDERSRPWKQARSVPARPRRGGTSKMKSIRRVWTRLRCLSYLSEEEEIHRGARSCCWWTLAVWHESLQLSGWSAARSQSEAAASAPPTPICGTCATGRKKAGKHFWKMRCEWDNCSLFRDIVWKLFRS